MRSLASRSGRVAGRAAFAAFRRSTETDGSHRRLCEVNAGAALAEIAGLLDQIAVSFGPAPPDAAARGALKTARVYRRSRGDEAVAPCPDLCADSLLV